MVPTTYPTRQLGRNGPTVSAMGLGAMGKPHVLTGIRTMWLLYGGADEDSVLQMLAKAANSGVTFWDTADAYGESEATIGKWFKKTGRRADIFLSTKFGGKDFTENAENIHVRQRIASSISLLDPNPDGADEANASDSYIDLYFQHRVDPDTPIEVAGKIRYVGLSDPGIDMLRRAKAVPGVGEKVVAAQVEFSPFELETETSGFVAQARELDVAVVAYQSRTNFEATDIRLIMPRFEEANFAASLKLVDGFKAVAKKYDATPSQIALAWILAAYPDFVPIPGTRSAARVEENAKAAMIKLSDEDVKGMEAMVRNADVKGSKIPSAFWKVETERPKKST
ncbi:Aldo/keto reductase [Mycena epipterygia]|nr:Aldo/keto reductase [Mycena epipterygia]